MPTSLSHADASGRPLCRRPAGWALPLNSSPIKGLMGNPGSVQMSRGHARPLVPASTGPRSSQKGPQPQGTTRDRVITASEARGLLPAHLGPCRPRQHPQTPALMPLSPSAHFPASPSDTRQNLGAFDTGPPTLACTFEGPGRLSAQFTTGARGSVFRPTEGLRKHSLGVCVSEGPCGGVGTTGLRSQADPG